MYEWAGNNSIIPELWLVPHFLPINPGTCLFSLVILEICMALFVFVHFFHTKDLDSKYFG